MRQSRVFKRVVLQKLCERRSRDSDPVEFSLIIASEFLSLPTLDKVDRLSTVYGFERVRRTLSIIDNLVFAEFFYGKLFFYPLWIKQFAQLLAVAKTRHMVRDLMSSSDE
ncbi:MAG: hypothetical protein ABSF09_03850 [Candidatus Bathyarchaeia archaeon]